MSLPVEPARRPPGRGTSHIVLLSVPRFVFLGLLIEMTGLALGEGRLPRRLLRQVRGGVACVLVGALYLVAGSSGSRVAGLQTVSPVAWATTPPARAAASTRPQA